MRERASLNTSGPVNDSLFSYEYNHETFSDDKDTKRGLQDKHKHAAKMVFEDLCSSLRLNPGVARKALVLFCTILPNVSCLRNLGVTYAACMFHGLE